MDWPKYHNKNHKKGVNLCENLFEFMKRFLWYKKLEPTDIQFVILQNEYKKTTWYKIQTFVTKSSQNRRD